MPDERRDDAPAQHYNTRNDADDPHFDAADVARLLWISAVEKTPGKRRQDHRENARPRHALEERNRKEPKQEFFTRGGHEPDGYSGNPRERSVDRIRVAIGLMASTSEEFLFRLFAIPFLENVTRSRVLAVILPAFSWSFLHSAYPQEPGYIRGIEVGIIGIVAGIVMLRWGILATLIWHYTVDASLVGLLLVRSNSLYFKISGAVVAAAALAPLAFACVSCLTRGRFETDEDLVNRSQPDPETDVTSEPE